MKLKDKTFVFYNNMETQDFETTKNDLFDNYAEEEGWLSIDDIPDSVVYHEMELTKRSEWDDFMIDLDYIFSTDTYLLTGTCGRWYGPAQGGKFISCTDELLDCIRHLDYIKFYDKDGHFYIKGYHHDGSDSYEMKRLTKKGYEFAGRNYFAQDQELHTTIMNCNFYSALPQIAKRLYDI